MITTDGAVEVRIETVAEQTPDYPAEHRLDLYRGGVFITTRGYVTGPREAAEEEAASIVRGIAFEAARAQQLDERAAAILAGRAKPMA